MSVYQRSSSLAEQPRLEVIPINCIGEKLAIMLEPRTLLFVSSTCGTVFQQIVWIFSSFAAFKRTVQQIDVTSFLSC